MKLITCDILQSNILVPCSKTCFCVKTFYWKWMRLFLAERYKKKTHSASLSTCSKTQCMVLKTVRMRNFCKMGQVTSSWHWRQQDERGPRSGQRKWGLSRRHLDNCLQLTGSQPGETPSKPTKHAVSVQKGWQTVVLNYGDPPTWVD